MDRQGTNQGLGSTTVVPSHPGPVDATDIAEDGDAEERKQAEASATPEQDAEEIQAIQELKRQSAAETHEEARREGGGTSPKSL